YLDEIVPRGYQIRLLGYDPLTGLGTTASTQVTATMEIDEEQETILYAEAARILLQRLGFSTSRINDLVPALGLADGIKREHRATWGAQADTGRMRNPWSR